MKKIKKFLAGIVSLSLLGSTMFALPASASGEISEHWSVSGADDDNYILVTSKYAYEGNNALHVVHSDGTDTALNLLPTWSDSESADLAIRNPNLSDEWARIDVNSTLTFYAKGTLPEAASFQIITTNGRLNASADKASWTVGEPDANGWYKVTIKANQGADYGWNNLFGNLSGNQGFTGLHISGDCDFYADNFTLTVVTSKSWIEHRTLNVLTNFDPGFEAATVTEIVPPEYIEADEFDVEEPENSFITEGSSWTVSYGGTAGTTGNNYISFGNKYAHSGNNSAHIVYTDTANAGNSVNLSANIPITGVNLTDLDILDMSLKFYVKGNLPQGANGGVTMGLTNGFYNFFTNKHLATDDNTGNRFFKIGKPDANGWQEVEVTLYQSTIWHGKGTIGGNLSNPVITITGPCNFYVDDFSINFNLKNSNWSAKTVLTNLFDDVDTGFEGYFEEPKPEYNEADEFDRTEPSNSFITEGESWTVSYGGTAGTTGNNYISFGNKYAHSGNNSAHIVYTDTANAGNSVNLSANIPITGVNLTDLDILDMSLKFYVKGNLPEGANGGVTMGLTNGFYNFFTNKHLAKDDNTDHAYCKIGKPDANGWQEVEVTLYQSTIWHGKGTIGGNLSNPVITITGPCNFYVDDFSFDFNLKNSNWSAKTVLTNLFDDVDTGFEGYFEKPEPQYDDDEEYEPAATRTSLISDGNNWTVSYGGISGTTGNNYISFSNKYAHTGNNSAHIVYTDDANASSPMTIEANIPTTSVSLTDCDIAYITLSFYVKGNLPQGASSGVSLGLTNGFYTFFNGKQLGSDDNAGNTSFTISDPDANGWQKVDVKLTEALVYHGKGTIGGNLSNPKIAITGPCNFYADDFSLKFKLLDSGWGQKTLYENVLATCDPSFENYYEGTSDIIVSKFDEVDFGQSQFSITGQNAQVITADIKTLENGLIMASVPVYNEKVSPFGVMYIAALYKDGQLIDASVIKTNINAAEATSINLVTNVQNVDENAKYELKAFLWDNAFEPVTTAAAISNK